MTNSRGSGRRGMRSDEQALVRVGPMLGLAPMMREFGHDPEPIFREHGFTVTQFENPDFMIPFIAGSRLVAGCVEATGFENFGLLLGQRTPPSSLGIAGFMLQTARDCGTALKALVRHYDLHDQGATVSLRTSEEFAFLGYSLRISGASAIAHIYDLSMTVGCKILRGLCDGNNNWNPTEVLLAHAPPRDPTPYVEFFRAPIRFDAEENAVVFPAHLLRHQLTSPDELLFEYLEQRAAKLRANGNGNRDLISKLHQYLHGNLITGEASASRAARYAGMSEHTLYRRLREHGTSFRRELNEVRYAMARNFLASSKATNGEIALALGYADTAAFSRSFRRWSGTSPSLWRKRRAEA